MNRFRCIGAAVTTLLAAVAACGGSSQDIFTARGGGAPFDSGGSPDVASNPEGGTTPEDACVGVASAPSCGPALDVSTADEVFAEIAKVTESVQGSTKKGAGAELRPTVDLRATTKIELDVAVFNAGHPSCNPNAPKGDPKGAGCVEAVFANELTADPWYSNVLTPTSSNVMPAGATCADGGPGKGCTKLTLAPGTTVRFGRHTKPIYFGSQFPHMIHVTRACAAPCDAGELRCAASATCITGEFFCALCEGKPLPVCACRDVCARKAEGAQCGFLTSDDFGQSGACVTGTCATK